MEPVRKPQPLHSKSFRYLAQPATPSPLPRDQCKHTTKRSPHSQSNEDIPRPIPPLPLSRTVGFEMCHTSPLGLRNSSISISSAASSGRHYNVEPSPWAVQSNSSVLTRSSLAYSIVHQNRSSSRSNWEKDGSNAPSASCSKLISTPSNSKTQRTRRRRSEKRESRSGGDMVPSPSPSLSRHSATRGSANRPSLFHNMPKPFWLQSAVSSDASEEEPGTGERKMTECEALLVPTRPTLPILETMSQYSDIDTTREDACINAKARRASAGVGEIKPSELCRLAMRTGISPSYSPGSPETPPLNLLRPKVSQPPSLLRRGSVIQSPCMSPSLTALSASSSIGQSLQADQVNGRRPTAAQINCTTGDSLAASSPRRSANKARLTVRPSGACQAIDRLGSQEVSFTRTAQSPSPSPRRSSVSVPREEWKGCDSSDRLADIFAQLVEKSQQLRAAQTGSSYGSGILTARTTVCGSPDSHSAAALTARLSDASTTDKTIKTTRGELRNSEARLEWRDSSRASKQLASRRSITRLAARSPGPTMIDFTPHGPPQRPAGEPSIIDRVNLTKLNPVHRAAGKRKAQTRYSAPVSSETSHVVPARTLLESETRHLMNTRSQSTRRTRWGDTFTRTPEPYSVEGGAHQSLYHRGSQNLRHRHAAGGDGTSRDRYQVDEPLSDVHMSTESRIRRREELSSRHHHHQVADVETARPSIFT